MGEQEGARDGVAYYQADDADVAEEKGNQRSRPIDDTLAPRLPSAFPPPATVTSALPAALAG